MSDVVDPRKKLLGMLARIFTDAEVSADERRELKDFVGSGALGAEELKATLDGFAERTWAMANADGQISDRERERLRAVARELGLKREGLPAAWVALLEAGDAS